LQNFSPDLPLFPLWSDFLNALVKLEPNPVIPEAYFSNQVRLFTKHTSHSSKRETIHQRQKSQQEVQQQKNCLVPEEQS